MIDVSKDCLADVIHSWKTKKCPDCDTSISMEPNPVETSPGVLEVKSVCYFCVDCGFEVELGATS